MSETAVAPAQAGAYPVWRVEREGCRCRAQLHDQPGNDQRIALP